MDSEKEFSKPVTRQVAPIGAALTPGLIPFWSPRWKGFAAGRQPMWGRAPISPPHTKSTGEPPPIRP
jgi:hypothetical protein